MRGHAERLLIAPIEARLQLSGQSADFLNEYLNQFIIHFIGIDGECGGFGRYVRYQVLNPFHISGKFRHAHLHVL
jgi:hypothetical protein